MVTDAYEFTSGQGEYGQTVIKGATPTREIRNTTREGTDQSPLLSQRLSVPVTYLLYKEDIRQNPRGALPVGSIEGARTAGTLRGERRLWAQDIVS